MRRTTSVGANPRIESGGFDSFGNFCRRARRLDSKVKESIPNRNDSKTKAAKKYHFNLKFGYLTDQKKYIEPHFKPPTTFL
jgi:hypothetical protein